MKKVFLLFMFMLTLVLISCGGGSKQDLKTLRSVSIDDTYLTKYNINFSIDDNSKKLYSEERTSKNYYDIYVSNDVKASLVTYSYSYDEYYNERLTQASVRGLTFLSSLYTDEAQAIAKEAFNAEYGIPQLDLGFTADKTNKWEKSLATNVLKSVYADGVTGVDLSITYLPVFVVRHHDGKEILKTYAFLPVYMGFTKDGKEIVKASNDSGYELKDNVAFNNFMVDFEFEADKITLVSKVLKPEATTTTTTK